MSRRGLRSVLVIAGVITGVTLIARRLGYNLGGNTVVRCRQGHLFTTMWIPLASFKAIRLGWVRLQRCPVGDHLAFVTPVRPEDLTEEERWIAAQNRDVPIP